MKTGGRITIYPDRTELVKRESREKKVWHPEEIKVWVEGEGFVGALLDLSTLVKMYINSILASR